MTDPTPAALEAAATAAHDFREEIRRRSPNRLMALLGEWQDMDAEYKKFMIAKAEVTIAAFEAELKGSAGG